MSIAPPSAGEDSPERFNDLQLWARNRAVCADLCDGDKPPTATPIHASHRHVETLLVRRVESRSDDLSSDRPPNGRGVVGDI
jgi:hypothetical protein